MIEIDAAERCAICRHIRRSHWQGGGCGPWCCTGFKSIASDPKTAALEAARSYFALNGMECPDPHAANVVYGLIIHALDER